MKLDQRPVATIPKSYSKSKSKTGLVVQHSVKNGESKMNEKRLDKMRKDELEDLKQAYIHRQEIFKLICQARQLYSNSVKVLAGDPTDYYNADSCVVGEWAGTGTSPYVDAEDHPTNYISAAKGKTSGDIGFENMPANGWSISEVIIEIDWWSDYGSTKSGEVYVWDNSASAYVEYLAIPIPGSKPSDGVYQTIDVSSIITTEAEVNALKIYIVSENTTATYYCDHCRLKVTYSGETTDYSDQIIKTLP